MTLTEGQTGTRLLIEQVRLAMTELFGAERRLRSREQQEARELTTSQLRALMVLKRADEVTAGDLARSADLNPASVTAMLDHLEAKGIIERRRSSSDRRVCKVSLSPVGRALVEERQARWQAMWDENFADFSAKELSNTLQVMRRMVQLFDHL